mmetsp:Transcript_12003/g.29150  ORF Transcript_12003/g.29150 Transcript_12003/m.29150 type:complete len:218 (-) Transcript_12003:1650-2303(-)
MKRRLRQSQSSHIKHNTGSQLKTVVVLHLPRNFMVRLWGKVGASNILPRRTTRSRSDTMGEWLWGVTKLNRPSRQLRLCTNSLSRTQDYFYIKRARQAHKSDRKQNCINHLHQKKSRHKCKRKPKRSPSLWWNQKKQRWQWISKTKNVDDAEGGGAENACFGNKNGKALQPKAMRRNFKARNPAKQRSREVRGRLNICVHCAMKRMLELANLILGGL